MCQVYVTATHSIKRACIMPVSAWLAEKLTARDVTACSRAFELAALCVVQPDPRTCLVDFRVEPWRELVPATWCTYWLLTLGGLRLALTRKSSAGGASRSI